MVLRRAPKTMVRLESVSVLEKPTRDRVHGWLRAYNVEKNSAFMAAMERGATKTLAVVARDDDGAVLGALIGDTLLEWLRIHVMAVSPSFRRTGIGTQLLAEAETVAKARRCTRAYV